jgi:hypothetical protein
VEWEVAAASDSELGLLFQPAKARNWKPCAGIGVEEKEMSLRQEDLLLVAWI